MSEILAITCPKCQSAMKLPMTLIGKRIRCKKCETVFAVPNPAPSTPMDAPIGFKDDPPEPRKHHEDDDNPYGVTPDDLDVPRCPFCAIELDPPDTKICLNCGYNLVERRRHSSVKTVDYTATDWILHLGPGVLAALTVLGLAAFDYYVMSNMREWMTGGLLDSGEKDKITEQTIFYIPPYCFNLWIGVFTVYIMYLSGKFAYRRLYLDWRPPEKVIIDKGD